MNAKHRSNRERQTVRLLAGAKGRIKSVISAQGTKKIHLVKKLTLPRFLDDQFKAGGGEGGLFHKDITFKSGATMAFAELL